MTEFIDYNGKDVPIVMVNTKTGELHETTLQKLLPDSVEICKDSK